MSAASVTTTEPTERLAPSASRRRPSTNTARHDRKLVNSRPRRNACRKPTFPLRTNDLRTTGALGVGGSSSSGFTAPSTAPLKQLRKQYLNDNEEHQSQRHNDSEEHQRQNQNDAAHKPITTPKAKIAADILKLFRKLEASAGNDQVFVFTLNVDQKLLQNEETPANFMQRIIKRRLEEFLGRKVVFVGVLEWRRKLGNELHLHGCIILAPCEKQRASEAFRAAGGPWRDKQGAARQLDLRPIDLQASFNGKFGLDGWALYCADDSRQTQLELDRRREALDPQQWHFRAPNIILKSGLNAVSDVKNSKRSPAIRDVTKISDVENSIEDRMGRHTKEPRQRFTLRIKDSELAELDGWIVRQGDASTDRATFSVSSRMEFATSRIRRQLVTSIILRQLMTS